MSVEVVVVPNALEPLRTEVYDAVPELVPWLIARFGRWPETARLYHRAGGGEYDVTPEVADDVPALAELEGTFVVRIFPAGMDPLTAGFGLLAGGVKWLYDKLNPDLPNIKLPAQRSRDIGGSPNNSLGQRSNKARPEERIPYILGAVRSVPDLLTVPYTTYADHVEIETAYYCVGVGGHVIQDVRDGDMLISQIPGASAEVYGPGKAPTGGIAEHEPDTTIGEAIEDDVYTVYAVESVNGQETHGFSDFTFYGSAFPQNLEQAIEMFFFDNGDGTGLIGVPYNSSTDEVTDRVEVGDQLFLFWPMDHIPPGGVGTAPDLGTPVTSTTPVECAPLTVTAIDDTDPDIQYVYLTVAIPVGQQGQWAALETYFDDLQDPGNLFPFAGATFPFAQLTNLRELYAGPFFVDFEHPDGGMEFEVVCNFVAPRGLYADDGVTIRALFVEMQVILTPADASGSPTGPAQAFQGTLEGSASARGSRALTLRCKPTGFTSTRCLVQARRLTNTPRRQRQTDEVEEDFYSADLDSDPPRLAHFSGNVVDEIRWTHCYSMSKPGNISFGNVTTIHTRTVSTSGALRVKERQLNCFAYRKIQTWDGSSFGGTAVANDRAENALFTVMKDSTIGNLADANIDFPGIAAAFEAVRESVWSDADLATSFNYTFDEADSSFEETMQAICQSAFCVTYRVGDVLKARPELAGDDSSVIFNHRNVLHGTQRVMHTFGEPTENDSIEVTYTDPLDDANSKVVVPKFGSKLRTKQLRVIGLRNAQQAYWHAYRAFHKQGYQRQSVSLEATQEAEVLGARERILVADETRSSTQAGEITGIDGSTISTSQPVTLEDGRAYTIHLQVSDGTTESFPVIDALSQRELELDGTPDPIIDEADGVRTTYLLVPDDGPAPSAFLVSSVVPSTPMTHQVEAVNYSHMYYLADGLTTWVDFSHGLSDLSPVQRSFTNNGGSPGGGVWTGSFGDSFDAVITTVPDGSTRNYSKLLFVTATADPANSGLIQSGNNDTEQFAITVGNQLVAGHGGSLQVGADFAAFLGSEHMVGVTYEEATERMALFIDGAMVDEATVSPTDFSGVLDYLQDFEGTCRVAMKWGRALTDREMMEIYLRTRLS